MKRRDEEMDDRDVNALLAAIGLPAGMTAVDSGLREAKDYFDFKKNPAARSWDDFMAKLQPGDVLFSRTGRKYAPKASLDDLEIPGLKNFDFAKAEMPITEHEILTTAKGDPYFHGQIYKGKGLVSSAEGADYGVKGTRLSTQKNKVPSDFLAYRPKNKSLMKAAVKSAKSFEGMNYPFGSEWLKHGAEHLLDPRGGPATGCAPGKRGLACTELVTEAYPDLFKNKYAGPAELRHSGDMEMVARYAKAPKVRMLDKFLARGVYPMMKYAKWGLPAAAMAYAFTGDENESG